MAATNKEPARFSDRAAAAREFLTQMWNLENHQRPGFMFGFVGPRVRGGTPLRSALFTPEGEGAVRDRLRDPSRFLKAQLEEVQGQMSLPGDVVPSVCPAFGVVGIPSSFGCEVVWWEDNLPAVRPLVAADPVSICAIRKPSVNDGELGRVMKYTEEFIRMTGGGVPIRLTDIQGPLDSAALVVGHTEFLGLMMTDPAAAHHLLRTVTELAIDLVKAQRELIKAHGVEFVPSMFQPWIPEGVGVSVSNDECVMISAAMHDEFSVPYINMLSEEFGGVAVHSCGDWTHQFPSLDKVHNLRGLEFGATEAPFERVFQHFAGRTVLACRVGLHRERKFAGMKDYVGQVLKAAPTYRGLFINVDVTNGILDETWPETDIQEITRMITNCTAKA
jgi:hypothetical protein